MFSEISSTSMKGCVTILFKLNVLDSLEFDQVSPDQRTHPGSGETPGFETYSV